MEKVKDILEKIVKDFGINILDDNKRFKAVFMDYSKGEYQGELELFSKIIGFNAYNTIINSEDLSITKQTIVKKINKQYFIEENIIENVVEIYTSFLRKDNIQDKSTANFTMDNTIKENNDTPKVFIAKHNLNKEKRERHIITTVFIILGIYYYAYLLLFYFKRLIFIFHLNIMSLYVILCLFAFIGAITGLIFILYWKKKGFWLLIGSLSIFLIANIFILQGAIPKDIFQTVIWSVIFWAILQIPKNGKSTWLQLS